GLCSDRVYGLAMSVAFHSPPSPAPPISCKSSSTTFAPRSFPTRRSSDLGMDGHILASTLPRDEHAVLAERLRTSGARRVPRARRSEEHTSELQSPYDLVCRLLLEKKKRKLDDGPQSEVLRCHASLRVTQR